MSLFKEFLPRNFCGIDTPSGDAGGGAPAASSTPPASDAASGTGVSPPTEGGTSTPSDDFMNMGADLDDVDDLPAPSPAPADAAASGEPPPPAADATPPPPAKDAAPPPPAPPAPPGPKDVAAPAATAPSLPSEPRPLREALLEHRDAMIGDLAAKRFALSKEEQEAIETDVIGNVPKIMARVYFDAVETTLSHIANHVPRMIHQHLELVRQQQEAEQAFYGSHKALDKTKHHADVLRYFGLLRQGNPNAPTDELGKLVAAAVMAQHGLTAVPAEAVAAAANGGAPPVPRPPATPSFVPARPGTVVRATPEPENEYMGMGRDYDEDGG